MTKNPENYMSIRWQRQPVESITAQIAGLSQFTSIDGGEQDANVSSQLKLLEIERQLTTAHNLFFKRQYQKAIESYTTAQGLIYQMIKPSFPMGVTVKPGIRFPLDQVLMEPLLTTSLKYVEALTPRKIEPDFAAASIDVPREASDGLGIFDEIGVNLADNIGRSVHYDSQLAASYADQGQWEKAAYFYQSASKNLGDPQTKEGFAAKAAIELNLGGVLVQMDRQEEAVKVLNQASDSFARAGDAVGQAQAHINIAASLTKSNQAEEAKASLTQARELLIKASGITPVTNGRPVVGPSDGGTLAQSLEESRGDGETTLAASAAPGLKPLSSTLSEFNTVKNKLESAAILNRFNTGIRTAGVAAHAGSLKTTVLDKALEQNGQAITYRQVGKGNGWVTQGVESRVETEQKKYTKELGLLVGDKVEKIQWESTAAIPANQVVAKVYDARVVSTVLADINWCYYLPTDFSVQLPHMYYYVIPVALGDCYHELGEFDKAEDFYLKAANYSYINLTVEVPALWQKTAKNVLEWGNSLYRDDAFPEALEVYRRVLEPPTAPAVINPEAPLYKHDKLKATGDTVKAMLENYAANGAGSLNPALATIVLEIRARMLQLNAGLDFLGMQTALVPIWSFEYLQNIARYFAQQVISAERDFINFWDRGENEALTRQQLEQSTVLAQAEQELAKQQREAAEMEKQVYVEGQDLAAVRQGNAQANFNDYSAMSAERISLSWSTAWYSSQNPWERGNPIPGNGPDAGKEIHQVIAEKTARQQTITRDYELAAMGRQIDELQQAEAMAQAQVSAGTARVEAAQQMEVVAQLKSQFAQETLAAFNNQVFTPEVWYQLGNFMKGICQSYLYMSIRVARMMQRAYNFENDLSRKFIKTNYVINPALGKLAGDALLLDINNFTYDEIATVQRKQMPIRQTISLASRFPFLFETQFKATGKMDFETRLEDFDMAFPGTYSQRIERIEVEVEGILPVAGVRGTLTNGGISRYRTTNPNEIKFRIQSKETLVLSEYRIKEDAIVFPGDQRLLKIFEGAGTAGTWQLEIPKSTNDLDFNTITDIKINFYYQARYDQQLATAIQAQLAAFAGANFRSRVFSMRWTSPDAFFHFQDTGQLTFSLGVLDFPFNETNPQIKGLAMLVATNPGLDPTTVQIRLGVPAVPATIPATPNAQGEISVPAGHAWEPLKTGAVLGNYLVEVRPDENPGLVVDGQLKLDAIADMVLVIEYEYTPRT